MLIDTSGLLCLIDRRDVRHVRAGELYAGAPAKLVDTDRLGPEDAAAAAVVGGLEKR